MNDIIELTDREHILARPSMYIGGVDKTTSSEWLMQDGKMVQQSVEYVPGLLKIINEIIDNSVDVAIKTNFKGCNKIEVKIDKEKVFVKDNGTGIKNEKSPSGKLMAELAWGHARAGSNFSDNRTQIGMNGIGSFATNCFSKKFTGISDDGNKRATLVWTDNAQNLKNIKMDDSVEHGVTVEFYPDLERFGMSEIDDIHIGLIQQRLINLKISFPEINFKFNGRKIAINSFKKLVQAFGENAETLEGDGYSIAILPNEHDDFQQFSYVNGLKINDGGSHIDYIVTNVVNRIREKLIRKYKSIKPGDVRNKLFAIVFFKGFPDAKFSSQAKEKITNAQGEISKFLGNIDFDEFCKRILKNKAIVEPITDIYRLKEELKRRQEMKNLDKVKKIKDKKYLSAIGTPKYLLIVEGECLMHDTKVLMSDFSTKPIRKINVGDTVLGDDFAPTYVTAKSSLLKQCIRIHTNVGTIECPKSHKLKCYDTKDNSFKALEAGTIVADTKRYKLLKSKIDSQTRGLKVKLVGKRRDGTYYFSTELNEFIRFSANDVFTVVRDSYCMPCSGPDLQTNDVVLLSREQE